MSKKANDDALLKSAARGDKSGVSKALKAGVDANVTDERLRSPLILAAEGGHEKVIRLLLERGADVRHTDRNGATALHYVMRSSKLEALDAIVEALEKSAKADLTRKNTSSSIRRATAAVFKAKSGSNIPTQPVESGPAATFRKWINLKDDHGHTPLHVAITAKAEDPIIRRMLLRGADPSVPNKQGKTVLDICDSERADYVTCIIKEKEDVEARAVKELIEAVQNGKVDDLSMYLRNISRPSRLHLVNGQNEYGQTALYVAAGSGQLRVLQMLIDAGANANVADFTNRTALHNCAVEGQKATALILCSQGSADVNARDMLGRTPLHWAAEWGRKEMAAFLLTRRKVTKVPVDNLGQTPLHRAAMTGRRNTTKLLLKRYSYDEANMTDRDGNTALHLAARWRKAWICEVLAEGKMKLDLQNKDGDTALHVAISNNRPANVKALIERGADPSVANAAGDNAVHAACRSRNAVVLVEALLATARLSADEIAELHAERKKEKEEKLSKLEAAAPTQTDDDSGDEEAPEKKKRSVRNISWAAADHFEGQGEVAAPASQQDGIRLLTLEDQKLCAVNAPDKAKNSPMAIAVSLDNTELAASLAFFGAKLDAIGSAGSALKKAVADASDERQNATPVSRLKEGIRAGDLPLVRRCLAAGVSINHVYEGDEKRTPLHFACASNKPDIVTYLVMHGANPDAKDAKLRTPAEMGGYGLESIIEDALIEYETKTKDDKRKALFAAIEKAGGGAVDVIKKMSQESFDLNSCDESGYTALHVCALADNAEALGALLKCGLDVEVQDAAGRTPLQLAADRHHRGIAQILADKGAKLNGVEIDKIPDADAEAEELAEAALSEKLGSPLDSEKKQLSGDAKKKGGLFKRQSSDAGMMSELARRIPLRLEVIKKICLHLQRKHLDEPGLFRLSGLKEDVLLLHNTFDRDPDDIELDGVDVHVITGALKHYLREQSMPLVPFHLYDSFLEAFESSEAEQMPLLLNCLDRLPPENKPVFQCLWQLLAKTIEHVDKNKMTAKNLGIIFGPTLMRPEKQSALEGLHKSQLVGEIFALLIENHKLVTERLPTGANYRIFKAPPPLTDQDWNVLLTSAKQREYGKDEFVLKQGSKNFSLFRMKRGSVRVEVNGSQVARLNPGEIFGELSFLGNFFTSADVISNGADTVIYEIEMKVARAIFAAEPQVFYKFYYNLAYTLADRLTNREAKAKHAKTAGRSGVQKSAEQIDAETEVLKILDSKGLAKSLRDYLKANKQHGNVLGFWRELQDLKSSAGNAAFGIARTLFDKYMKDPSSFPPLANQVQLCKSIESDIMQGEVTRETFVPVEDAVLAYMASSVLPAFKESDQYKNQIAMIKLGVYKKDGSYQQYEVHKVKGSAATIIGCLAAGLNPSMSKKERDSYQLYAVVDDKASVMSPTSSISELLESSSGGKLLYTDVNPEKKEKKKKKGAKVEEEAVVIKEYACKCQRSGKLLIKQHESQFQAKVLGLEKKVVMPYSEIAAIEKTGGKALKVKMAGKTKANEFKFNSNELCDEAYGIIEAIWNNYAESAAPQTDSDRSVTNSTETDMSDMDDPAMSLSDMVPEDDVQERHWEIILMGGREVRFKRDDVIIKEGEELQRIYQIVEGTCRVEKVGFDHVLARMPNGSTFGEMSFLLGGGASASVIADSDEVTVFIIEADYFKRLFNERPELAGRWFKYLATVLESRFRRK